MPPRARAAFLALAVALGPALVGCTADASPRRAGTPVTAEEARVLAGLLHRNFQEGGADFVVTAPYGGTAVLTLTGEVDFRDGAGHAEAVTSFGNDRADDVRTLFFTREDVWVGDLPGLADAVGDDVAYLRRPLSPDTDEDGALLVDVLVDVLLHLGARTADDPRAFRAGDHTWEGQRSIDSRLTSLFGLHGGATVAVGASDDLLVQYASGLPGGVAMTVTLADHGRRDISVPTAGETALAVEHPEVAEALGV
ncbi:MAG: uncharacterized protein JWQ99_1681 [Blastococcus sp.]|jgi:hypothetical protein|nr:uncharacterized protein [Blastococcus sp.]